MLKQIMDAGGAVRFWQYRRRDPHPSETSGGNGQLHAKFIVDLLAKAAPFFPPKSNNGYHAITYGYLAGELVRRCDPQKRTIGRFFGDEVAAKLGLSAFIGTPEDEHYRISPLQDEVKERSDDGASMMDRFMLAVKGAPDWHQKVMQAAVMNQHH